MKVFGITIGSPAEGGPPLVVGGYPVVDLLPQEVRVARRSRGIRRGVISVAALLVVVAIGGGVAAKFAAVAAEVRLAGAQVRTEQLLAQQAEYFEVTSVQAEIDQRTAARYVITSTEIDWRSIMTQIRSMLPAGATVLSMDADGASPMELYAQATSPLQGARVATVRFTIQSSSMLSVPALVDQLATLPGFVDAQVPSTTATEEAVETSFVVHLDQGAYANRFPVETPADGSDPASPGTETSDDEPAVEALGDEEEAN
ncbi:hypothetical protein [Agrococcus baldri]|uniref:Fimbrial assembly protein (PilN) n=1 Tax=Agrococcus baldri TaxID=153730 RepID=A0AA87RIR3_9MICO|nr:hypothetical protein [Agrococcus baldri]GEK80995.1 hypothetical protein ABA31_23460 [Agrococcus baldri]